MKETRQWIISHVQLYVHHNFVEATFCTTTSNFTAELLTILTNTCSAHLICSVLAPALASLTMDPVTAFSLAAGIVQVVDASFKAIALCRKLYKEGSLTEYDDTAEIVGALGMYRLPSYPFSSDDTITFLLCTRRIDVESPLFAVSDGSRLRRLLILVATKLFHQAK